MEYSVPSKLSKKGIEFLTNEEGVRLTAYLDGNNTWTIGYGNTYYENKTKVKKGDKITKERAIELFHLIRPDFEKAVKRGLTTRVAQHQFDALVSLAYNIGTGGFSRSNLRKYLNTGGRDAAMVRQGFLGWIMSNGKPVLRNRRLREAVLFNEGVYIMI